MGGERERAGGKGLGDRQAQGDMARLLVGGEYMDGTLHVDRWREKGG